MSYIKNSLSHERGSERSEQASKRVSAVECASKASSPKQTNEWAVRANERANERVAQYFSMYSWLFWTIVRERDHQGCHNPPCISSFFCRLPPKQWDSVDEDRRWHFLDWNRDRRDEGTDKVGRGGGMKRNWALRVLFQTGVSTNSVHRKKYFLQVRFFGRRTSVLVYRNNLFPPYVGMYHLQFG